MQPRSSLHTRLVTSALFLVLLMPGIAGLDDLGFLAVTGHEGSGIPWTADRIVTAALLFLGGFAWRVANHK